MELRSIPLYQTQSVLAVRDEEVAKSHKAGCNLTEGWTNIPKRIASTGISKPFRRSCTVRDSFSRLFRIAVHTAAIAENVEQRFQVVVKFVFDFLSGLERFGGEEWEESLLMLVRDRHRWNPETYLSRGDPLSTFNIVFFGGIKVIQDVHQVTLAYFVASCRAGYLMDGPCVEDR